MAVLTADSINLDAENVVEFTISVGDTIRLCPPAAYLAVSFTAEQEALVTQYLNGFIILNPDLGEFTEAEGMCVKYKHNKSGKQIIQYASKGLGEKYFYAIVSVITVNDHASIHQGGPAFATYYAETPTEEGGA